MSTVVITMVVIPGAVALLVFLLFTYLFEQSRKPYFRAWQLGWAAYVLHYAADAWNYYHTPSAIVFFISLLLMVVMALCIFVSTRLMRESFHIISYDVAIAAAGVALALWNVHLHMVDGVFRPDIALQTPFRLEAGLALVLFSATGSIAQTSTYIVPATTTFTLIERTRSRSSCSRWLLHCGPC